ncbi:ABC transporter ATP-binding protein [Egibacter rhizosphaerae]|uniref:ABC transporter ATP-binding protein n=1 Tax=Egibacter rhizosphaerae TaxID=1670831 RepID=A0A411YB94_9ACTN|nr:ABC transporter ATP-binding protein [Egibacter rhizosphaerae]QBI18448.1 ABC transporter ATP-binding protein [Egibacter rhizosphaerae]
MRRRTETPATTLSPRSEDWVADRPSHGSSGLWAEHLELAYDTETVVRDLSLEVPEGRITVICGPNACGKSTLLRGLARLLRPRHGAVHLDGQSIARLPTRVVAMRVGLLPQAPQAPEGLTVEDLVARGRFPHQRWFQQWSYEDERAVDAALALSGVDDLRDRPVDELSGGQRQRAWIAMALAQETPILLLDEPTTFLDLAHQVEVLDLLAELNERQGRTVVMVLHDLNEASRYAHHLVAMRGGRVHTSGAPAEILTPETIGEVFGVSARVIEDPVTGTPLCVPYSEARSAGRRGRSDADRGAGAVRLETGN